MVDGHSIDAIEADDTVMYTALGDLHVRKICSLCFSNPISNAVGVCVNCLREKPDEALLLALENHAKARLKFELPPNPPNDPSGVKCTLCRAECVMGEGSLGYCGLRGYRNGGFHSKSTPEKALLYYYLDRHITNCCNAYFCPAGTGLGYPKHARCKGPEHGYYNLALFLYGCGFNCLFCQNWSHKVLSSAETVSAKELIEFTLRNSKITCWCWFGGSAEPQLPFTINASKQISETKPADRIVRVCYEWNGDGNPLLVKRALEVVLESGGNVKFDLKAYNPNIHRALTGMDNDRVLENFGMAYEEFYDKRRGAPILGATTLLVPHYVDAVEVARIAEFIASLDENIPYSLLVFHPDFLMTDIPVTPREQVRECYEAAKKHLKNVNIGNLQLIGSA